MLSKIAPFKNFVVKMEKSLEMHREVSWLSKNNCRHRFVELWNPVPSFMANKQVGEQMIAMRSDTYIYLKN